MTIGSVNKKQKLSVLTDRCIFLNLLLRFNWILLSFEEFFYLSSVFSGDRVLSHSILPELLIKLTVGVFINTHYLFIKNRIANYHSFILFNSIFIFSDSTRILRKISYFAINICNSTRSMFYLTQLHYLIFAFWRFSVFLNNLHYPLDRLIC